MFGSRSYRGSVLCRQPPLWSLEETAEIVVCDDSTAARGRDLKARRIDADAKGHDEGRRQGQGLVEDSWRPRPGHHSGALFPGGSRPGLRHEQSRFGSLRHMHANIFRQSEHVTRSRCFSKRLALEACSEVLDARVSQFKEQAQVAAARDMIALATVAAHARTCWHGAVPDRRADELSTPHRLCFFGCLSDQLINGCVVFRRRGSWRGGALTI